MQPFRFVQQATVLLLFTADFIAKVMGYSSCEDAEPLEMEVDYGSAAPAPKTVKFAGPTAANQAKVPVPPPPPSHVSASGVSSRLSGGGATLARCRWTPWWRPSRRW